MSVEVQHFMNDCSFKIGLLDNVGRHKGLAGVSLRFSWFSFTFAICLI